MDKIRLRNYRCLEDTQEIEIKPITILVGANSSGKSSFIKIFPLLKQSIGVNVNGIFLWDGQYVDFQNFHNTVKDGKGDIIVDYFIDELPLLRHYTNKNKLKNVHLSFTLAQKSSYYDYLKCLSINCEDINALYEFEPEDSRCKLTVNECNSDEFTDVIEYERSLDLFPTVYYTFDAEHMFMRSDVPISAYRKIKELLHEKISAFDAYVRRDFGYGFASRKEILGDIKEHLNGKNEENIKKIVDYTLYCNASLIYSSINAFFSEQVRNYSYVLPLRSNMQRYYRFQNKDVEEIDPDGDNLAMFLNSLETTEFKQYNKWLKNLFKFELDVNKSEGHVELLIKELDRNKRNLIDVGIGYTQILPILTIIWKAIYMRPRSNGQWNMLSDHTTVKTIAIEQPELHLHPRFQKMFASMLAAVVKECRKKNNIRIVLETHSDVIINTLGELIERKELSDKDVNVVLFNACQEGMNSYVHSTSYTSDGMLKQWPYGFFS